ncbi:VIT domain-containing protein [Candidatus Marithrix sp. Canyon 246]|uniref:VIT domain-containing protein n=1 Tax=Candidatus Marithrix sp. Canyon 246 TaxID=1827136 RepID=UPI00084A057B|nr:VIT domain-containing protein [Candidatus Marithrix sp. Canyon 246]
MMLSRLTAFIVAILSCSAFANSLEVSEIANKKPVKKLELPLKHTKVEIEVSGFVASATVTQQYHNPFKQPIEAIYTFPLPHDAAVNQMQMFIGKRKIEAVIKTRNQARKIYKRAKLKGQRASLLEQQRPNIFTQSVTNIMPGDNISIKINYVGKLKYKDGNYELVFPMVVGTRYRSHHINPLVLEPNQRSGHDIDLSVTLDAGVPIQNVYSNSHVINIKSINRHQKYIKLHRADRLPNKDFILGYQVAGAKPEIAVMAHAKKQDGFFSLMIQPPARVTKIFPRELIFIVDTSGSMRGFPLAKSKKIIRTLIQGMRKTDTFNVVRFAGDTGILWNQARHYTPANANEALRYVDSFQGRGGTAMRQGILNALSKKAADGYLRIAFLLTDGYVGNEFAIFQAIEKQSNGARIFSVGIGSSVNRYLLERASEVGRGETFYIRHDEKSDKIIQQIFRRVDRPTISNIEIDWASLDVHQLSPSRIPDLWAGQPILINGRYTKGGIDTIIVRGKLLNQPYQQKVQVHLPPVEANNEAIATIWARQKVRNFMNKMVKRGQTPQLINEIQKLGLKYRLMTQWTSFVAVEEKIVNGNRQIKTIHQAVEMPEAVSYEGVFGLQTKGIRSRRSYRIAATTSLPMTLGSRNRKAKPSITNISFFLGSSRLNFRTKYLLRKTANMICRNMNRLKSIKITGYANDNSELSLARANTVADYLVNRCSALTHDKIIIKGKADKKSIVSIKFIWK